MRSSSGFNRTSYSPPRVYAPTQIPVQQQYVSRLPPQTSSYTRSQVSYPGIIGGTQYLHPQAGLSSIPSSRPLGSSVLTVPTPISYNNFIDQRPVSIQTGSYSPPRVIQAPTIATSTVANQLPAQLQTSYKQVNPLDGSYYNTNVFEQSQIQKTMNTTQIVRKFNNTSTHVAAQNSDQINEIQLDRIKVYKKANVEKFFGRDVTIDCNYEPYKLFSTKELRGFLVNGFQEFEQNLKKLEQRFSGLESSFYHLLHKGDTPKDIFDRFLVTLDKRVEKFFESFDESVIQGRGLAADYFDTSVLRNDYEFWNFRSVVKQGVIEISNKLNDLFVSRENSTYYDAQIIRCIETIIKLYSFLKSDLNTILNKSILKCGKILEACTYFYENGEGVKTINFADYIQLDVASLISQYSDEFDRTYPVLLNKKQIVTEKFHDILKDKSTQNQFDLKQLVRSVFQRERRKLYRTIYNSIVNNGKNELELSEEMLSLNKTITDKMNKIKSKYLTIKNDPLFMEVLTGRMNIEYLKNSPTLFEENSQTVLLLEKFMVNTQQFYEDIKDALSDIIYYKQKEQDINKDILQGILSKAVYDLNQQEKIIQDKGDMSELILYQFQVLEKSLSSDHNRQNVDTNLESTLMKQLKNNQTNYHLHNVAADLARQEKQREEQRKAMKDNQFQKTKEFSSQIANLMTKPMIDKERNMYPVKDNNYDQYDDDDRNYDQSSSLKGLADKLLQTIKQKREEELEKERKLKEEQEEIRYMKEQQYKEERERMQLEKQRMVESTSKKFQERREQEQAEFQQRIQMRQLDEKERRERELDRQREEDYKKQRQNEEKQKQREEEERQRKAKDEELKQRKLQDEENRRQRDEELKRQKDLELKKQREEDERKQQLEQERKLQQQAEQEKRKQAELEKRKKAEEEENKRIEEQKKRDQQKKIEQEELKKKQEQEEQKRKEEQRIKDEQFRIQQEELKKKKEQEEQKRKEEQRIRDEQLRVQQEEQKKRLEEEQRKKIQQQQEEEMRKKKIQEELELKKKEEEEQRKKQQELDRLKKEEEERIKKIEEQKKKEQMEQDRLKKEEEERKKKLEEQKRKEQMEQERLKKEEEDRLKKAKYEEEEKERKRILEEKQKEEQNKKDQKGSGFNYDDIGGSEESGSQYKDEFDIDDYDEILGKDNSKNKKANETSKNTKGFDQDDLYEEIAEDSDNFNDFTGKLNKPATATAGAINVNNNVKKPEPIQSKVKNDKYDDFEDLDDNFDDFDDDDLEDKKKTEQPPAKTNLPSLSNNTKKAEDSKRSNIQNSYEDDFEEFDDFSDKKKKDDQKPAQQVQEQKKSDKKSDIDYFEDIEEDIDVLMGDTSNNKNDKSGNNISKTNPTTTATTAKQTTQQPAQDKNKKQSNFDYDLDFDDEDDDQQGDLEKDFKQDIEKQPQKNNPPPQKSKENEYDYDFDDEDEEHQQDQNPGQMTQEQMEQIMQAEQERELQNMELTYDLIQKTNEYVKKTRFGRSHKANLSNYNSYDYVIRLYEEYIQNLQVFLFDYPESMKLLDLYEAYINQQNEFEQLVEEYGDEIQKIYYENTKMTGFAPTTKLYFPLEANSIGFQLIEVNLMNQTVSYFYMVDENEEQLIQQLNEFHRFFTFTLGLDEFQASPVKVEDSTLKILQIYEQEHYLQYMCMLFPLVYEFMSDIAEIKIDQNTIDRIFYIQLSLELFYTELETNEEQVTEKFNSLLDQYCNHKEFAVNIQDYQELQSETLEQILNEMNQFKEQVLQSEEQKYGLVMFSISTGEIPFCFYFYVTKSADEKVPHEIGLFCLTMSDQINNMMVEQFDQLQEENVVFRPHVDSSRHNGLYDYREFTIATWAHLIEKKNFSPFIALNIINFSMIPYYITYKGLD